MSRSPAQDPTGRDHHWLQLAVDLARRCPPSPTALSVGVVIADADADADADGVLLATGFSREAGPHDHAEEAALAKLDPSSQRLGTATLYSSIEPCGQRRSRPQPCAELIVAAGIRRVVFALREPTVLVAQPHGADRLRAAGVEVVESPAFVEQARLPNAHLLHPYSRGNSRGAQRTQAGR